MTVIVAVIGEDHVSLAADSIAVDGDAMFPCRKLDVFETDAGPVVYGAAGDAGLQPVMAKCMRAPTARPDEWAQKFAVRATNLARERLLLKDNGELDGGGLFAFGAQCWALDAYLAFPIRGFAAIGSGSDLALGALEYMQEYQMWQRTSWAAGRAVGCAIRRSSSCGGEIQVLST